MDLRLMIALAALLVLMLLPQLDRINEQNAANDRPTSFLARLAHWVNH